MHRVKTFVVPGWRREGRFADRGRMRRPPLFSAQEFTLTLVAFYAIVMICTLALNNRPRRFYWRVPVDFPEFWKLPETVFGDCEKHILPKTWTTSLYASRKLSKKTEAAPQAAPIIFSIF
jgi:hypothetical protein